MRIPETAGDWRALLIWAVIGAGLFFLFSAARLQERMDCRQPGPASSGRRMDCRYGLLSPQIWRPLPAPHGKPGA